MKQEQKNDHRGRCGQIALVQPQGEAVEHRADQKAPSHGHERVHAQQAEQQRQHVHIRPREIGGVGDGERLIGRQHAAGQRDVQRPVQAQQQNDDQRRAHQEGRGEQPDEQRRGDIAAHLPVHRLQEASQRDLIGLFANLGEQHGVAGKAQGQVTVAVRQQRKHGGIEENTADFAAGKA